MRTVIVYPVPMETPEVWHTFKSFVKRFADTMGKFHPTVSFELVLVCNKSDVTDERCTIEAYDLFESSKATSITGMTYEGGGADLGSFQYAARQLGDAFMICCVTRVFFHRADWLEKMVNARLLGGPGLYGTSASREGGKPHICTRCYGMDADVFAKYPKEIDSRDWGTFVEIGLNNPHGSLMDWHASLGLHSCVVYAEGVWPARADRLEWLTWRNTFRRGDQSNLIVSDKHSQRFDQADDLDKETFTRMVDGELV